MKTLRTEPQVYFVSVVYETAVTHETTALTLAEKKKKQKPQDSEKES